MGFSSQRTSNAESGSMQWHHYGYNNDIPVKVSYCAFHLRDKTAIACSWWRHQTETFSASLDLCNAFCEVNPPITGGLHSQRPVRRSFDVFFDVPRNKRLSKQSKCWWFGTPRRSLWRHCEVKSSILESQRNMIKILTIGSSCNLNINIEVKNGLRFFTKHRYRSR